MDDFQTYMVVDLDCIQHNLKALRKVAKMTKIAGVVKANAYGLGANVIARELERSGIDYLCVANVHEGIELRKHKIYKPILILGYTGLKNLEDVVKYSLTATVYDFHSANLLNEYAKKYHSVVQVHIKINTGMNRLGYDLSNGNYERMIQEIRKMYKLHNVKIEGIFSHFSDADAADNFYSKYQYEQFINVLMRLEEERISIPLKHISNDAATILFGYDMDMVRLGIGLFGYYASNVVKLKDGIDLRESASLFSTVTNVHVLEKGEYIGYNRTYQTPKRMKVATVAIGYADGYPYALSNKGEVLINGKICPIVGKVCMDQLMVQVDDVEVNIGDAVMLFGTKDGQRISIYEVSQKAHSFVYEFLCNISSRVPRIYTKNREIVKVVNYLERR